VRGGRILAAEKRAGSPHDTVAVEGFGGAEFCAGCHQFNFPRFDGSGRVTSYTEHEMQATVSQFHAWKKAGGEAESCRSCHATSPGKHTYPGAHDPAMLERALELVACKSGAGEATVMVKNRGAGHHVPTGDVHRHLFLRVWRSSAPEKLFEAFIGRRYEPLADGGKRTSFDSTIPPGGAQRHRLQLARLGGTPEEPINIELRYVYTIDEVPLRGREVGEATWRSVSRIRHRVEQLPVCRSSP
jgi:hypothetical protein